MKLSRTVVLHSHPYLMIALKPTNHEKYESQTINVHLSDYEVVVIRADLKVGPHICRLYNATCYCFAYWNGMQD